MYISFLENNLLGNTFAYIHINATNKAYGVTSEKREIDLVSKFDSLNLTLGLFFRITIASSALTYTNIL